MKHDVYAYGVVCPSRLALIRGALPKDGHYAEMISSWESLGGEAANASMVLAALGIRVKLDGNWIEDNVLGRDSLKRLQHRGVDISLLRKKRFNGPEEWVIASEGQRAIFGKYGALLAGRPTWNKPRMSAIRSSRAVLIDPFFKKASRDAARAARAARVPYVTVDGDYANEVIRHATAVVISGEFRPDRYKTISEEALFKRYMNRCDGLVIFTSGSGPVRYGRAGCRAKTFKPPVIKPVDTTGAGDSFRAGIVYGLLRHWTDEECIRFSSALAAMNCLRFPGVLQSPSLAEVQSFMRRAGMSL